jgi:ADP-heptose:LPS heptosyltransferase
MKFLITRFSSIGDIVLTTPVVRCLKKQVVTAEIHFLTKAAFKPIVESNPYIDKTHYLENDKAAVIEEIRKEDVDYVIDLHHNVRTVHLKRRLGKKAFSFNKLNIEKWLLTNIKLNVLPKKHIVDRYMQTVAQFGVRNDNAGLDYFIPEKDKVKENDIPASHHAGYIGIVIGAAHNTKKMPLHKLQELCRSIQHPIILLGGKEDEEQGNQIAAVDVHKIYNACGKFNINESADLVRRSKLIITHDTGLMHIAAAFRKPILSIWGNTVPAFGMYPYFGLVRNPSELPYRIMEVNGLSCRPCSKIGYNKCPRGHFKCMELQNIDTMIWQTNEWLGRI